MRVRTTATVVELKPACMRLQDIASGPIWQDYIALLMAPKPGTEDFAALFPNTLPGQEEQARTTIVR